MKTIATILSALLLAACNVYLPEQAATGGAPLVVLPDAAPARGLIRTGGGECLDVHGGDGKTLIRHACHGRANQQFRFDAARGTVRQNGGCLDVAGGEQREGTPVILYRCHGGRNQQWYDEGAALVAAADPALCLDASDSRITVRRCNGSPAQAFFW